MFEHFDERARMCVAFAQEELRRLGHEELGTVHLLLGVARVDHALLGVEAQAVRAAVVALQGSGPPCNDPAPVSAEAKAALEGANGEALALGHTVIDPAHIMLALLDAGGGGARALREAGAIPGEVRERATAAAGTPRPTDRPHASGHGDHAHDLRDGHPVPVTLGSDALPLGDLGHARVGARLLELLLVNDTPAARLLREHGIDEAVLRDVLGPTDLRG